MSSVQPEDSILQKKLKTESSIITTSLKKKDGYPRSLHLMLDLETKAKTQRSMIMQIGAVVFTPNDNGSGFKKCLFETFFINIEDVRKSDKYDIDPETIGWWEEKDKKDAWKRYLDAEDKVPIKEGLEKFVDFVTDYRIAKLWAKPSRFDFAIIEHAFNTEGVKIPWFHADVCCLRSIVLINETKFIKDRRSYFEDRRVYIKDVLEEKGIDLLEHNPVYDCFLQIYDLLFFHESLEAERLPKPNLSSFILNSYYQSHVRDKEHGGRIQSSSHLLPLDEGGVKDFRGEKKRFVLTLEPLEEEEAVVGTEEKASLTEVKEDK